MIKDHDIPDKAWPYNIFEHYYSLSLTDYEMRDIENRLTEWGTLEVKFKCLEKM